MALEARLHEAEAQLRDAAREAAAARDEARKRCATIYRKKYDTHSGYYYYENVHTGISMWEAPLLFQRLFPQTSW